MNDWHVYCPSYKRSDIAISHKLFKPDRFTYVVRESEYEKYLHLGVNLLRITDPVNNICETRNWIYDHAPIKNRLQVDDDMSGVHWFYKKERLLLDIDQLDCIITRHFEIAEDLGIKMWGLNILPDPIAYTTFKPYNFNKPILGPFTATLDMDLRHDPRLTLKEDYDMFLQVMHKYGKVMRCNFLSYQVDHQKMRGGCQTYRTIEKEREQNLLLQKKWGSEIVITNTKNAESINMRIML